MFKFTACFILACTVVSAGDPFSSAEFHQGTGADFAQFDDESSLDADVSSQKTQSPTHPAVFFYHDRAEFEMDAPGLFLEDFEGAAVDRWNLSECRSPLSNRSSEFFPDGIAAGLEAHGSRGWVVALGADVVPFFPTKSLAASPDTILSLVFTNGPTYAVGLDAFDFEGATSFPITVTTESGSYITQAMEGFWGIVSDEPLLSLTFGDSRNLMVIDNVAFEQGVVVPDADHDGVADEEDLCANSNLVPTIVINRADSQVVNRADASGCTLADKMVTCNAVSLPWQFINCMKDLTSAMVSAGELTTTERDELMSVAPNWGLPNPTNDSYNTTRDTTLCIAAPGVLANDTDPQGSPLEAHLLLGPASGRLSLQRDGSFCYTPAPGFKGYVSFTYKAYDRTAGHNIASVTIRVVAP